MSSRRAVIVGASLAGLTTAESLRALGYRDEIVVLGEEPRLPYDRPPLSKRFLTGPGGEELTELPATAGSGVEWRLGVTAAGVDLTGGRVHARGEEIEFDDLVIATGSKPKILPVLNGSNVYVLRTLDDALALRSALQEGGPVVVVGGGFIGLEVAASCRKLGLEVCVLETLQEPLVRAIGPEMGRVCRDLHEANGTRIRTDVQVTGTVGAGRVEAVVLGSGELLAAATVVVSVGVRPATSWLIGNGLDLSDGVACDSKLRVLRDGAPLHHVVAAGDIARWAHPLLGREVRVEHWTNAVEQGEAAARTLMDGDGAPAMASVPYVWSDQYDRKLQFVGWFEPGCEVKVEDGSVESRKFVATYRQQGRMVGAFGFNRPAVITAASREIANSLA